MSDNNCIQPMIGTDINNRIHLQCMVVGIKDSSYINQGIVGVIPSGYPS